MLHWEDRHIQTAPTAPNLEARRSSAALALPSASDILNNNPDCRCIDQIRQWRRGRETKHGTLVTWYQCTVKPFLRRRGFAAHPADQSDSLHTSLLGFWRRLVTLL